MKKLIFPLSVLFILSFFSAGCSLKEEKTASVVFKLDSKLVSKINSSARTLSPEEMAGMFFDISLKGDYEESQTIPVMEGAQARFMQVPVDSEIYAEAEAYRIVDEEKKILYSGKTDSFIVKPGENQIPLKLKKVTDPNGNSDTVETITIYISATGSDETGTGSQELPFASITYAVSTMNKKAIYNLKVDGVLTGVQQKISETGEAVEIILSGANGCDATLTPQDAIDRGISASTNGTTNGNALIIDTDIPVTIEDLKIMRGAAADGSAVKVCQGATVKLGNGVLITQNYYQSGFGTVRNEGTLFMYGSAVIGDRNASASAKDSSSTSLITSGENANYSGSGGGIYNGSNDSAADISASLYLGYSGFEDDGETLVKEELTGGIYKNGGGGIYNSSNSYVYFDSGNIEWNAKTSGAGIYNAAGATLKMSGGNILNNISTSSSDVAGAGVYNEASSSMFVMSGGTINQNKAICTNTSSSSFHGYGGGVFNGGKMFMCGSAVIGNKDATSSADSENNGNYAREGGGIYCEYNSANSQISELYLGYVPDDDGSSYSESKLSGGIYYNYADTLSSQTDGGGAICSMGQVKISSGTIAFNATSRNGGGVYYLGNTSCNLEIDGGIISSNKADGCGGALCIAGKSSGGPNALYLGGSFEIPEADDLSNDIYLGGTTDSYYSRIYLTKSLDGSFSALVTPESYTENRQLVMLSDDSSATLEPETSCFKIRQPSGINYVWTLDSEAKLVKATGYMEGTFDGNYVSRTLKSASGFTVITSDLTGWDNGWYLVDSDIEISERITVSGSVNLILCDGATLTASKGITVSSGNTFTVYGQSEDSGKLIASGFSDYDEYGENSGAAIGGIWSDMDSNLDAAGSGSIIVHGGTITATSGSNCAGIGTAGQEDEIVTGSFTIFGGSVTASGGDGAAGIGGRNDGGTVIIYDGTVNASCSEDWGAGIGGGFDGKGGNVTIYGGSVTATGGGGSDAGAAGIGGGGSSGSTGGDGGSVSIYGGTVVASGGNGGAGIGGGKGASNQGSLIVGDGLTLLGGSSADSAVETTADDYIASPGFFVKIE
ncbi:hypothetical protein HNP77_000163 [Treponema rectale]|nr:hypothetical protein [Treponema rectale]MBB5217819.1 hypothetical protein [Treponema rectale]